MRDLELWWGRACGYCIFICHGALPEADFQTEDEALMVYTGDDLEMLDVYGGEWCEERLLHPFPYQFLRPGSDRGSLVLPPPCQCP